ncbi:MAG: hypothetical protein EPO51_09810 [Phenylobacterium sp.]|uniref:hypothetical protein n=1 Tax=Phenylobacterium sp. TaxID=1871053 RepID=UPI00120A60D0|nr:hypothetical protein [Phenylobacterium sp.]TAJ72390.1 MAG: hypothetical protein EPO51_09810 [Phenylobacterium sp.]
MAFLPPSTNHEYRGADVSVVFLGLCAVLTLVPGAIHSFLPDGGAGVIAHLDVGGRAALVRALFACEGATQLAFGLGMMAVALRYRPLTPLFLALVVVERGLMSLQGWVLLPPPNGHHPPEHFASPVTAILALAFLALALRPGRR